jgi:hypothetical protein
MGSSLMPSRIVIGFVQAQMLRFPISRLRPFHNNGSRLKELCIVNVGPSSHDAQRAALPFDQEACFDPWLCSVLGLGPICSPQNGPCP